MWGTALFQSVYQPAHGFLNALPLMPEWYLFSAMLGAIASLGFLWSPLLWVWGLFVASLIIIVIQATLSALKNVSLQHRGELNGKYKLLIIFLHVIQPMARLYGRLNHGLTPWRKLGVVSSYKFAFILRTRIFAHWSEEWRASEEWLADIEKKLISYKTRVKRGGEFDRWDIMAAKSMFSITKGLLTVEEHGGGKQLVKLKVWPAPSKTIVVLAAFLTAIAAFALIDGELRVTLLLLFFVLLFVIEYLKASAEILHHVHDAFLNLNDKTTPAEEEVSIKQDEMPVFVQPAFVHVKSNVQTQPVTAVNDGDGKEANAFV